LEADGDTAENLAHEVEQHAEGLGVSMFEMNKHLAQHLS
jgi:hypothetical protein